jgi:hypothetical protein
MGLQVSVQKASFAKPALRASGSKRVAVARPVSCSAQKEKATAVAAAALAVALSFGQVDAAYADVAGLTPCSESKAFQKREKKEIATLQKRLKQASMIMLASGGLEKGRRAYSQQGGAGQSQIDHGKGSVDREASFAAATWAGALCIEGPCLL